MRSALLLFVRFVCLLTVTAAGVFILLSYSPIDPIRAYIGNDLLHVPPEQYPATGSAAVAAVLDLVLTDAAGRSRLLYAV